MALQSALFNRNSNNNSSPNQDIGLQLLHFCSLVYFIAFRILNHQVPPVLRFHSHKLRSTVIPATVVILYICGILFLYDLSPPLVSRYFSFALTPKRNSS